MTTREAVLAELDRMDDEHLAVAYRLIQSLEVPTLAGAERGAWKDFVAANYGCMRDAPIERGAHL